MKFFASISFFIIIAGATGTILFYALDTQKVLYSETEIASRPGEIIEDSTTEKLLELTISDEIKDIESDLIATQLRDLNPEAADIETVLQEISP